MLIQVNEYSRMGLMEKRYSECRKLAWHTIVCEVLLLHMNLKKWAPKRLSTIFGGYNDELKGKVNATYLFLGNDGDIAVNDRNLANTFNDLS